MDAKTLWGEVLRWRGELDLCSSPFRRSVAGLLVLFVFTLSFTTWGHVGLQFSNGDVAFFVFMFEPIALAAMLLGTGAGAAMGLFVGVDIILHAWLHPMDYFDMYVTPLTTIAAMLVCGCMLGVLFGAIMCSRAKGWVRALLVSLACIVASFVSCVIFGWGDAEQNLFERVVQSAINAFAMMPIVFGSIVVAKRANRRADDAGLRVVFGVYLSMVVVAVFMVVSIVAYEAVTRNRLSENESRMRAEVSYYLETFESLGELKQDSRVVASPNDEYDMFSDALLVVTKGDRVVFSNDESVGEGSNLQDVLSDSAFEGVGKSLEDGEIRPVVYYYACAYSDFWDVALPGETDEVFESMSSWQLGYLAVKSDGDIKAVLILPASVVFESRNDICLWITYASFTILAVVFAITNVLLDRLVGRRIDETNTALARITDGDLDVRVESAGTHEFVDLSSGINSTVEALKGWIADAESRMDSELMAARSIQESALPSVFPPYPDIKRFDIYASMSAAKEVGGDFFDLFLIGDDSDQDRGRLAFVLADVSGKGVPAALFMMKAKTQIHDYLDSGMELGEAIENANRQLCEGNEESMFVTAWVGILDYATLHMEFVNAGHNPPAIMQGDSWRWLKQTSGLPLGMFDDLTYRTHSVDCEVGDLLFTYTDGVTEAFSVTEEQYGEDRLMSLLEECRGLHPRELIDRVSHSVATHAEGAEQSDDITMLAIELGVPPKQKDVLTVAANVSELGRVYEFIHDEADRRLCPVRIQNHLDVVVEELFVNICRYAYEGMGEEVDRYVRVTHAYSAEPKSITVEIIDDGKPFNPLEEPVAADGLGLMLVRKSAGDITYERVGDSNVVTLVEQW